MTNQAMFNRVWKRFVAEKAPAAYDHVLHQCVYETDDGQRCAFGLCMTKKDIELLRGHAKLTTRAAKVVDEMNWGDRFDAVFAQELQNCHDGHASYWDSGLGEWLPSTLEEFHKGIEEKLRTLAAYYNLTIPEVKA